MPTMPEYSGENVQTKRIGGTTYIVTSKFNGNAKRNPAMSLIEYGGSDLTVGAASFYICGG
jgi:hypothetical protein